MTKKPGLSEHEWNLFFLEMDADRRGDIREELLYRTKRKFQVEEPQSAIMEHLQDND